MSRIKPANGDDNNIKAFIGTKDIPRIVPYEAVPKYSPLIAVVSGFLPPNPIPIKTANRIIRGRLDEIAKITNERA